MTENVEQQSKLKELKDSFSAKKDLFQLSDPTDLLSPDQKNSLLLELNRAIDLINDDSFSYESKISTLENLDVLFNEKILPLLDENSLHRVLDLEADLNSFLTEIDADFAGLTDISKKLEQIFSFFGEDFAIALIANNNNTESIDFILKYKTRIRDVVSQVFNSFESETFILNTEKYRLILSKIPDLKVPVFFPNVVIDAFKKDPNNAYFGKMSINSDKDFVVKDLSDKQKYEFLDFIGPYIYLDPSDQKFDPKLCDDLFSNSLTSLLYQFYSKNTATDFKNILQNLIKKSGGKLILNNDLIRAIYSLNRNSEDYYLDGMEKYSNYDYPLSIKLIRCAGSRFAEMSHRSFLDKLVGSGRKKYSDLAMSGFNNFMDFLDDVAKEPAEIRDKKIEALIVGINVLENATTFHDYPELFELLKKYIEKPVDPRFLKFSIFLKGYGYSNFDDLLEIDSPEDLINLITRVGAENDVTDEFDPKNEAFYRNVFKDLGECGLSAYDTHYIAKLNFDPFIQKIKIFDTDTIIKITDNIKTTIHPKIAHLILIKLMPNFDFDSFVRDNLAPLYDGKTGKFTIDNSTVHSLNKTFSFLSAFTGMKRYDLAKIIKKQIPSCNCDDGNDSAISWIINNLDISKIDPHKITSINTLVEYMGISYFIKNNGDKSQLKLFFEKIDGINIDSLMLDKKISGDMDSLLYSTYDIELFRNRLNTKSSRFGDMIVGKIGSNFLENNSVDYPNLLTFLRFARSWGSVFVYEEDVRQSFNDYSSFAYDMIATFIIDELNKDGSKDAVKDKLRSAGIIYDDLVGELEKVGYHIEKQGTVSKIVSRVFTSPSYLIRKGFNSISDKFSDTVNFFSPSVDKLPWTSRDGVEAMSVKQGGVEVAKFFKFNPSLIGTNVLLNKEGVVDMKTEKSRLGNSLVFSAPVSMTTGSRKLTEVAFKRGVQLNWLTGKKEGYLIVDKDGSPKVLDKNNIRISDLISAEDLNDESIRKVIEKWRTDAIRLGDNTGVLDQRLDISRKFKDRSLFFRLIAAKENSLLVNMLVVNDGNPQPPYDDKDYRRLFLTFADGSFGVLNSTTTMTTDNSAKIAAGLGADKAVYMDTGMYDMASYVDGGGEEHIVGHQDSELSTNRLVIYSK